MTFNPASIDVERRRVLIATGAASAALWLPAAGHAQDAAPRTPDVPYVPTPMPVVHKMLEMAKVKSGETLYDLGCGDGRIVIAAAKEFGAQGIGIDINPARIAEAKKNAVEAGIDGRVRFMVGDLFATNMSDANVVALYLLPQINLKLRPQLWRQLKVGSRVVSHAFDMGDDWPPEQTERVDFRTIYAWTITEANKKAANARG